MMRPFSVGFVSFCVAFLLCATVAFAQPTLNTGNTYISGRMMRTLGTARLTLNYTFNAAVVGTDNSLIEWYMTTNPALTPTFAGAVGTVSGSATKIASGTGAAARTTTLGATTVGRFIYCSIRPSDTGSGMSPTTHVEIPWQEPLVGGSTGVAADIAKYAVLPLPGTGAVCSAGTNSPFFDAGTSTVCSGGSISIDEIGVSDIRFSGTQEIYLIMNWGDGTAPQEILAELLTPRETAVFFQEWGKKNEPLNGFFGITHTYNAANIPNPLIAADRQCTYTYTMTGIAVKTIATGVTESTCNTNLANTAVVWDTEDNNRIGTFDVSKEDGVGSEPAGQALILEICENEDGDFRLSDDSDFNCTPNFETGATSINSQSRWVQWVYGTTGSTVANVVIDGMTYTNAQFPIYGPIEYLPANVVNPNSITPQMSLPVGATVGQTLRVTLRSWNICNAYDELEFDGGLNEDDDGATDISVGTPLAGVVAASSRNADNAWREITYNVNVIDEPAAPTASASVFCQPVAGSPANADFNITFSGAAGTYTVYLDALLTTPLYTDNAAPYEFNPVTQGTSDQIDVNPPPNNPSVYHRYVTITPANGCESPPLDLVIEIHAPMVAGSIAHPLGASPQFICTGTDPAAFTSVAASGGNGVTFNYQWQSSPDGTTWTDIPTETNATFDPPSLTTQTYYRRRVRSSAFSILGTCDEAFTTAFRFRIDTPVTGGQIADNQTICAAPGNPANLTNVISPTGGSATGGYNYQWEFSLDNIAFNTIVGATSSTYDPPAGLTQTTFYRRRVTSGVCSADGADAGTDPDNLAYSTNTVTVTVHQVIDPGTIDNAQTICAGSDPTTITNNVSPSGGDGSNYVFQWQESSTLAGTYTDIGGATASTFDPPVLTATTFYRRRVRSPGPGTICTEQFSNVVEITVNALPTASISGGGSICQGTPAPPVEIALTGASPWTLTYSVDGVSQTPVVVNASPYQIINPAGDATADGIIYAIVSVSDNNTPTSCVVTAPHANITNTPAVSVRDIATPPPTVEDFNASAAVCHVGAGTNPPDAILDLLPDQVETYRIGYRLRRVSNNTTGALIGPADFTTNASGELTISPTYAQMGNAPDEQGYQIIIVSIFNVGTGCAGAVPIPGPTLIVNPNPTITAQPTPATAICAGGNPSFSVTATIPGGSALSYQWQESSNGGALWSDITDGTFAGVTYAGATTSSLTIANAVIGMHNYQYRVIIGAFAMPCNTTSNVAVLTVNAYPTIAAAGDHPQDADECAGGSQTFSVSATGPITGYRWQQSPDGVAPFVDLNNGTFGGVTYAGVTTATLTLSNLTGSLDGARYRVRVTSTGNCSIDSNPAELTVNPLPTVVTINPVLCDEVAGGALIVSSITLSDYDDDVTDAPTVIWYSNAARTAIVTTPSVTHNQIFYWRGTSALTCESVGQVQFSVEALPNAVNQQYSFCEDAVNAGVASNIDLTSFEFGAGSVTNGSGTAVTRDIEWYENSGLTIPVPDPTDVQITPANLTVYAKIINTTSGATPDCYNVAEVDLIFNQRPVDNPISGDAVLCSSAGVVKVYSVNSATNSYGTVHNYTWTIDGAGDNFQVFVAGTGFITTNSYTTTTPDNLIIVMFPNPGNFHFDVQETIDGCDGNVNDFDVSVTGAPGALALSPAAPTQVCKDQEGVIYTLSTAPNPGSVYTWTVIGGNVVGASSGPGLGTITVNWGSITVPQPRVTVSETNGNGCAGAPSTTNITLNDVPSITSPNTSLICSGSTPNSVSGVFTANIGGVACTSCTFSWRIINATANVTSGGLQVPIFPSAGGSGLGNSVPLSLVNASGVNGTVIIEVTAIENDTPNPPTCGSATQTYTVTILPEPVVNTVTDVIVCSGDPIAAINFSANAGGETFDWTNDNISILPLTGSGSIGAFTAPVNTTASDMVATITVTASKNGCTSAGTNAKTFTITVRPEPDYDLTATTRCSKEALGIDLSTLKAGAGVNATSFSITNIVHGALVANAGSPVNGTGFTAAEIADDRWTNTTNNPINVVYTIVPVTATCSGDPFTVTVSITPEPVYNNTTFGVCSDGIVNLDFATLRVGSSVVATTFNVTTIVDNGLTPGGGNVAAPANGVSSTAIQNDVWTNTTATPVNVVYTIVPLNGTCAGTPFTVTVTINPEPVYGNTTNSICSDDIVNISFVGLKAVSSVTATSFNITNIINTGGLTPAGTNVGMVNGVSATAILNDRWTNTSAGSHDIEYEIVPLNGTCAGTPFTVVITIDPEPVYSNATPTRCSDEGLGVDLSTLKNGSGVDATTYNITINSNSLIASAGSPVASGTGFGPMEIFTDAWTNTTNAVVDVIYTVTPVTGTCQGTPFTITMHVSPEPVFNNSIGTIRCSGDNIGITLSTLRVPTSVTANTFNITGIVSTGLVADPANAGITNGLAANAIQNDKWTNTTTTTRFVEYTIVPVNGTCQGSSFTVTITINPEPEYDDGTPTICSDDIVNVNLTTLKAGTSSSATSYNITNIINNAGLTPAAGNVGITNGLSATAIVNDRWTNITAAAEQIVYEIVPLNGTCQGEMFTVTVTVDPEPVYANASRTRCSDDAVAVDLSTLKNGSGVDADGYNITINANSLSPSAGAPVDGTGLLAMEISDDRWTNTTNSPVNVIYTIVPVTGTCLGTAFTVTVQVNPEPVYNNSTPTICSDDIVNVNFTSLKVGTSVAATTFNVTNIVNSAGLIGAGGNVTMGSTGLLASAIVNDRWTNTTASPEEIEYTIVPVNGTCVGTAFTITVTVNPEPVYDGITPTRCSDELVNVDLATLIDGAGVAATGYNITINANGLTPSAGSPSNGINLGALVISDDAWTNTTANPVDVTYNITPLAGTCQGTPFSVIVTVTPEPVYTSTTVVRCSDDLVNIDLNTRKVITSVTATTFNITINSNSLTASAGSPADGIGFNASEIADDRWTNTSISPVNVIYTVTPVNGTCLGNPFTITITVNPEPVGASTTFIRCNEEQFSINLVSVMSPASVLPSLYDIVVSSGPLIFAGTSNSHGNGKTANELFDDKWINTTPDPEDVTYLITPISASNCAGTPFTLTFTINPKPTAPLVTTAQICSDGTFNFDLQSVVDNTVGGGNSVESLFRYTITSNNPAVSPGAPRTVASDAVINDLYENRSNTNALITYTVIPISDLGCQGTAFEVRLTVFPEPVGVNVTNTDCITNLNHNIQTSHINAIGGNSLPSIFTYTVASSNTGAVAPGAPRLVATNANITDSYVNTSGSDVTITYTITPFNSANPTCGGTPFTFAVVISSRPVGIDGSVTAVCSDNTFTINPQNNITNGVISTFSWEVRFDPGLSGLADGAGTTITGSVTNNTTGVKNVYFDITPISGSCDGDEFTITQPINPEPVIDPSVTPRTICSDTPTNIVFGALGGTETPTLFDISLITQDPDLTGTPTTGLGLSANAIQANSFTNNHRTQGLIVQYLVRPYGPAGVGGCQGNDLIVQIEVLPEPVIEPALSAVSICSDVASGIQIETDGIAIGATSFFINSVTVQSTATTIAPNTTVASLTSAVSNITADPAVATGARSKTFIQNDKFTVTVADAVNGNNTVVYNVTPRSAAGCFGNAANINLLVLPEPQFDPIAPPPVCSDATIDLQLIQRDPTSTLIAQYNITGITFQSGLLPGGSNILIGSVLTADANGDFIDINDVYTNPSAASLQATYAVKPIAVAALGRSCEGDVVNAVVTIRPSPLVLTNLDKIVCNDAVTGITIGTEVTSAPAASYQVTRAALPAGLTAGVFIPGTQVVNGATTTNISTDHVVNSTNNPLNMTYTVRANTDPSGTGCYGPAETILVTVEPQIRATLTGAPGNTNNAKPNICSADDTEITLVSPSNPTAGNVTFNFTAVAATPGTVTGMSPGSNLNENDVIEHVLTNTSNNPVDVTYTITPRANSAAGGNGCIGTQSTTIVKVEPKPRMTATPATLTVCEGVPLGIDFATTTVPSTSAASMFFALTAVEDPATSGLPVNVAGFSTALPQNYAVGPDRLNDILTNTATEQKAIRYSFTPSFPIPSATCLGDPVFINVTVSPRPVMVPFTVDPKCSGESFSLDFSASVTEADLSSTLASWTFSYTPSGDPDLTGASNGAGFDLSQVVFNKNPDVATVTYAIKARSFGCESNTINVPVEVTPTPKVTGVASSVNVCNEGDINVPLASNTTNTLYTWVVDDESQPTLTGASDQTTPVGGPINYTLTNTSTGLSNYTFEITPQVATSLAGKVCVGDPLTMVANVAPPLAGRITTSNGTNESFLCSGSREFIFLEFDGLPLFDVVYREGSSTITLENQGAFKPIQVQPTATTEYELISVTDAFGCSINVNELATVNVNSTDATFSIVGDVQACSPHKVSFQYDQQVGVNYTWKWFDGPDSTTYMASTNQQDKIIKHTFENPSPVGVAKYKVYLETSLADTRYPGCLKTTFQEVRVSPNIALGVFADLTTICSGQTVTFTNTSQGATSHRWFYRPFGTTQENDIRSTVNPAYQLVNNTTQNPAVIEVVYQADNGVCPTTTTVPITVYRGVTASFDEGTIPPYQGGSATVTFTNTSTPLDPAFRYAWTFGSNSNPENFTGMNANIPVTYTLPGLKEVILVATNIQAESDGFTCASRSAKTIEILLPPLLAAFRVNPLAACFPVTIEVTENTSTGDTFKWQVIDQSGNIAATAMTTLPQFRIVNPGTYDIFLETSSSITGQTAFSQINGVEVFDLPLASLEARPTTLFVPDTELITFNFSTGANFYEWNFDDGTTSEDFEPTHFYNLEGTYNITLVAGFDHGDRDVDGDGLMDGNVVCYDTATRQVIAREGGLTKVPNAFTPNKNGSTGGTAGSGTFNDVFLPITKGVANEEGAFIMQIFDRWGTLVFESRSQRIGWDGYDRRGNLVPAGVYVYKLDLRLADGQRTTQVGDVTVIR